MDHRRTIITWWIAMAGEVLFLGWMARHGDFLRAGEALEFTVLGLAAGVAYWLGVRSFSRASLTSGQKTCLFWGAALVLRLAILPVLAGDDIWRYRWEGRIQLHGFNPYLLAPDAPALSGLRDAEWSRINHRDFPAIYPPMAELIFAALAAAGMPVFGYKLFFLIVDLGVVYSLRRLLARGPASPDAAAWYAWNPLAVYAAAGAAHFDGLMVVTLLWAIQLLAKVAATTSPDAVRSWRASWSALGSALLLGLSIAFKVVPLALVPVWLFALGWRRAMFLLPMAMAVSPALAVLYGFPEVPVFVALTHFAREFRVNDPIWWLVDALRGSAPASSGVYQWISVLVCGALAVWLRADWRRGVLWVLGATLLLTPVLHAWYAVWILPIAAWRDPSARPWFVLSISVFGYFLLWEVNHASGKPWEEPLWLRLFIYLPPAVALGWRYFSRLPADETRAEAC